MYAASVRVRSLLSSAYLRVAVRERVRVSECVLELKTVNILMLWSAQADITC